MESSQTSTRESLTPTWTGSLYYVFSLLMVGCYAPFLYVYFTEIGLSGEVVGWLSTLSPVVTILFVTLIASVADRTRYRVRIAQAGMVGSAISLLLLRFSTSTAVIAGLMLSFAVFSSPITTLGDSLISRMALRHGLNLGGMRMWGSLTYAAASLLFGAVWQAVSYQPMFLVAASLYLPIFWITGKVEEGPVVAREKRLPFSRLLSDQGTQLLLLATFLAGISNSLYLTFSGIFARSLGASSSLIGLMIGVGALAELPLMFWNERISDRLHEVNTIILSYGLMAAAYLGFVLTKNSAALPAFTIIRGAGYGLWFTVTIHLLIERTPDEWSATAQSLLVMCISGLSPLLAGPLGGWLNDAISPAAVFALGGLSLALAVLVLIYARKRTILI